MCKVELCGKVIHVVLQSHHILVTVGTHVLGRWSTVKGNVMCNKTKETEEQLPKHSQQEGLLMDMKSHTESI